MKIKALLLLLSLCATTAFAQSDDPVIMKIAGKDIKRSEFEYSYNKNNSEGVIDKKTVDEYVELFVNYKLKVQAALDEHMDTLTSYKKEFRQYRDQQIRPLIINNDDIEAEAHRIYDSEVQRIGPDGLCKPAHIFVKVSPNDDDATAAKAKARIDSLYNAVKGGADFTELAKTKSEDPGAAAHDGIIGWITHGQTFDEFDKAAYALKVGEMSQPVKSPAGWHIIKMMERKMMDPFDSLRANIMKFIERRNLRDQIADRKVAGEAEAKSKSAEEVMDEYSAQFQSKDPSLNYLIGEYHDGLLLYEISNREVWEKGASDEAALQGFFNEHKKEYTWDEPRFKGMVYHVKDKKDVKAVANCVKKIKKFADWNEALRQTFNNDSILRIRVEKGLFKKGDNALIDSCVFKASGVKVAPTKGYPIDATYGKVLKSPEELDDIRDQVVTDYQALLEKNWVADLRKRYEVVVYPEIIATVKKQ